ncbi:MAG: DUF4382 domain-containing protein [Gemmatimonadota bacterium]
MRLQDLWKTTATFALALTVAACSDGAPTGPGSQSGSASATLTDDPNTASGSLQPSFSLASTDHSGSASYSGHMEADVKVQVSADGQAWTDVNEQAASNSRVDFHSSSETTVASNASVDAGTYSHVRVVMENTSATIDSGSSFGASTGGLTLSADVNLTVGSDGRVVIEKQVGDFEISADSNTTITVDLNSDTWVNQDNVEARAVSSSEIESATAVSVN